MTNENEDRLHEMLCAYVLGEGSKEERAEVESALAQSAELRAERERIEATIGLVRGAMGDAETLSSEATAELLSAAAPRKISWHRVLPMRIAAGIAIAFAAFGIYALSRDRTTGPAEPERPRDERSAGEKKDEQVALVSKNERSNAPRTQIPQSAGNVAGAAPASGDLLARGEFKEKAQDYVRQTLGYTGAGSDSPAAPVLDEWLAFDSEAETADTEPNAFVQRVAPPAAGSAGSTTNEVGSGGTAMPTPFGSRKIGSDVGNGRARGSAMARTSTGGASPGMPAPTGPSSAGHYGQTAEARPKLEGLGYLGSGSVEPSDRKDSADGGRAAGLRPIGYAELSSEADDFFLGKDQSKRALERLALTPEQREQYLDEECRRILTGCYRRPHERPRDMFFRFWGDNPFEIAALDAQSTFSVDVDTASYALARRYLNEGNIPTRAQIRTEEFVNYFKADVPAPREGTFAIHTDLTPSRFSADAQRSMLRVVVRGREVSKQERKPLALTFVIDVSGSMREQNRLEMVKHTLRLLLAQLDANDSIAVVAFSDEARMILPMTSAGNRGLIESALFPLQPGGSTNSQGGLKMGYEAALAGLNPNATNRVVFLSDGVANVGVTDPNEITNEVQRIREKGLYLNTVGVGMNNHNDVLLEQLADKGDGVCNYVDTADEAKRVMVDGFTGAFEPIARDVKIQVEFDPAQVLRYRLLGYENRAIADKDFRNDKVDAGEVGAGHQVTALYEIERSSAAPEKPLATVHLRWKAPRRAGPSADAETEQATEIAQPVLAAQATSFEGAGAGYRRAVIVAQFAELLRRSQHVRGESLDDLIGEATKLEREMQDKDFTELYVLMQKSRALILANQPTCDELCQTVDLIRRNQILRAENEMLAKGQDAKLIDELERQNRELEERIRDLLRRRLENR